MHYGKGKKEKGGKMEKGGRERKEDGCIMGKERKNKRRWMKTDALWERKERKRRERKNR